MGNLQFNMTDDQKTYARDLLLKGRSKFESSGIRFTLASTLIKILEEWCRDRDFIKETKGERDSNIAITTFLNDPIEIGIVTRLIQCLERNNFTQGNINDLMDYVLRFDPTWIIPKGDDAPNLNKALVIKMKEILSGEVDLG